MLNPEEILIPGPYTFVPPEGFVEVFSWPSYGTAHNEYKRLMECFPANVFKFLAKGGTCGPWSVFAEPDVAREILAQRYGWTQIDTERMVGVPPIGPQVERPLPVPGMESSKGPHNHCSVCWVELPADYGTSTNCPHCGFPQIIVCMPMFCGSS